MQSQSQQWLKKEVSEIVILGKLFEGLTFGFGRAKNISTIERWLIFLKYFLSTSL